MRVASGALVVCLVGGGVVQAQPPPMRTPPATPGEHYAHTIVRGDTLIGLAQQLMTDVRDWPKIARLNRVRDTRRLRPGRSLLFPVTLLRGLPGRADVLWVRGQPRVEGAGQATVALLGTAIPPGSTITTGDGDAVRLAYTILDPSTGARRELLIEARKLPVADEALAESDARSIPHAIRSFSPHAVLSMGVAGGPDFMAEFHADDGGLELTGGARHADYRQPTTSHPDNYSLARAIHLGSARQRSNPRDLLIRSRTGGPTS